jgi:hypothetical protein
MESDRGHSTAMTPSSSVFSSLGLGHRFGSNVPNANRKNTTVQSADSALKCPTQAKLLLNLETRIQALRTSATELREQLDNLVALLDPAMQRDLQILLQPRNASKNSEASLSNDSEEKPVGDSDSEEIKTQKGKTRKN